MRIALITDAWAPQVNGVVRTLGALIGELRRAGHTVTAVTPDQFRTIPCPTYPEIRLALGAGKRLAALIDGAKPDAIHIATEGPLGIAARALCLKRSLKFTTAYHTRFPEYIGGRFGVPTSLIYALLRRFHRPSSGIMVATETIRQDLAARGFTNLQAWGRGVNTELFRPGAKNGIDLPRPLFLSVGRIAPEKNLEAFLDLDLPGSKMVIGAGPLLDSFRRRYPKVAFPGRLENGTLARHYAAADVFVFPSRTDTFGLVLLEALASGVPVAAFPVPGPLDVIAGSGAGCLDTDLRKAALAALEIPAAECREHALKYSWPACAAQFVANLCPVA